MSIEQRLIEALEAKRQAHDEARTHRLCNINARFERLVSSGAVQPDRYNVAPINPISLTSVYRLG
jgi:hypothetical protein